MIPVLLAVLAAGPGLTVSVDPCTRVSGEEIARLAAIELAHAPRDVAIVARLGCAKGLIELVVDDPVTLKTLGRKVDLSSTPPRGRARTLALALAELIEASWSELLLPAPRVAAAGPPVPEAQQRAVSEALQERERAFRLSLLASGQRFPAAALWEWGGGARLTWAPGVFGVSADFRAGHGANASALGTLLVDSFGGSVAALATTRLGALGLDGGLGLRGGSVRITGSTTLAAVEHNSLSGPWLAPMALVEVGLFTKVLVVQAGFEGGLVVLGVRGRVDGTGGTGIYGPYFQLSASVGLRL